jgi:hypothetical protein
MFPSVDLLLEDRILAHCLNSSMNQVKVAASSADRDLDRGHRWMTLWQWIIAQL